MTVLFHPEFGQDILRIEADYAKVSPGLAARFRAEIDSSIRAITRSPGAAGHFIECNSQVIEQLRRRNLKSFPFFVLYGYSGDKLVLGSVIASRSDPLTWLARFAS